eukprot:GHVR01163254.1.p1 GENE.GHVR01163254.1~~GHVR01163254.1.p1  ORF type:complete len:107 (+),score=11.78 GHVR01163254.1:338-658(+)
MVGSMDVFQYEADCASVFPVLTIYLEVGFRKELDDVPDTFPLVFNPKEYVIKTDEGKCILDFIGVARLDGSLFLLGKKFLHNYTLVFDYPNEKFGIANRKFPQIDQ